MDEDIQDAFNRLEIAIKRLRKTKARYALAKQMPFIRGLGERSQ
jgi:hypothetical protein